MLAEIWKSAKKRPHDRHCCKLCWCAGQNRREVVDESSIRWRGSDPHRPRVMRCCPWGQGRSVDRGCAGQVLSREKLVLRLCCQAFVGPLKSTGICSASYSKERMYSRMSSNRSAIDAKAVEMQKCCPHACQAFIGPLKSNKVPVITFEKWIFWQMK